MIYYRTRCFGLCLHDPLLIYLTLSKSAEYLSLSGNPRAMLNEFLWLRTEAIRIINERIGTPELESSDGVIDAVAHMAMYEVGNFLAVCRTVLRLTFDSVLVVRT